MRLLAALFVVAGLSTCDIEFVALDEGDARLAVSVGSRHEDGPVADVAVFADRVPYPLQVTVQGIEVRAGEDTPNGVVHRISLTLDSLRPEVDVVVEPAPGEEGARFDLLVPVLARRGAARCLAGGDLHLPLVLEDAVFSPERTSWGVILRDAGRKDNELRGYTRRSASGLPGDRPRAGP